MMTKRLVIAATKFYFFLTVCHHTTVPQAVCVYMTIFEFLSAKRSKFFVSSPPPPSLFSPFCHSPRFQSRYAHGVDHFFTRTTNVCFPSSFNSIFIDMICGDTTCFLQNFMPPLLIKSWRGTCAAAGIISKEAKSRGVKNGLRSYNCLVDQRCNGNVLRFLSFSLDFRVARIASERTNSRDYARKQQVTGDVINFKLQEG